jgi:hypothetical protein
MQSCKGKDHPVSMSNLQFHRIDSPDTEIVVTRQEAPRGGRSWVEHEVAAEAWERQHEAEWVRVDQKLRGIATRRAALDAEEANLLRYAEELKLWRGWGFGSMLEYMERAMGYAPHTAAERLRVARAIAELPRIAEALEQGGLAHSAVRELSRVAVPDTEAVWLEAASGKSLREIEAMVSGHKPGDLPTDETEPRLHRKKLMLEVSPETYDIWRKLHALAAEEHGQRLSDDELISSLFRRAYGDGTGDRGDISAGGRPGGNTSSSSANGAGSPAYKIAIKQCTDCKRAWQYSGGRDIEIDPAVAECAACDAVHLGSLDAAAPERSTTTVTPRKREQVLARDGHCCIVPGCRRNVGLDLHHIEYQSRGGSHELSNLTTICDLHHRAVHFGKLVIRGTAPDRLTFEFRKPRDRRNVTDDDGHTLPSRRASSSVVPSAPSVPELGLSPAEPAWDTAAPPLSPRASSSVVPSAPSVPELGFSPAGPVWDTAAPPHGPQASSSVVPSAPSVPELGLSPAGPAWDTAAPPHGPTSSPPPVDVAGESRRPTGPAVTTDPTWKAAVSRSRVHPAPRPPPGAVAPSELASAGNLDESQ